MAPSHNDRSLMRKALQSAIGFLLLLGIVFWLSTALVIVPADGTAIHYRLGRPQQAVLGPGAHLVLPFPLSEVRAVKTRQLRVLPIGFDSSLEQLAQQPLHWTKDHGEERSFMVGGGTEAIVFHGVLEYRVRADIDGIAAFAAGHRNPDDLVRSAAHRTVQHALRGRPITELLALDRRLFQKALRKELSAALDKLNVGVEVVGFHLLSLHPPLAVADSYLDVVNAGTDAEQALAVSKLNAEGELLRCEMMSATEVADAESDRQDRLAESTRLAAEFTVALEQFQRSPLVTRWILFTQTMEAALRDKPFYLLDANMPPEVEVRIENASSD